jgi:hypothetical protein
MPPPRKEKDARMVFKYLRTSMALREKCRRKGRGESITVKLKTLILL